MRRARGFTLIELLVAITVLAIVAVLGWRGLDSILRSRATLTEQMEHTRGIQLAFAQMQNDLDQLAGREIIGNTRQNLVADGARLILVRVQLPDAGPSQLVVVSYRLRDGVLSRRESPGTRDLGQLDMLWQSALSDADTVPGAPLESGIATMTVRLWDSTTGTWQVPANGTGNAAKTTPTGLEMSLQLRGESNPLVKVLLLGTV
jgi:general secretion pathway protein J